MALVDGHVEYTCTAKLPLEVVTVEPLPKSTPNVRRYITFFLLIPQKRNRLKYPPVPKILSTILIPANAAILAVVSRYWPAVYPGELTTHTAGLGTTLQINRRDRRAVDPRRMFTARYDPRRRWIRGESWLRIDLKENTLLAVILL